MNHESHETVAGLVQLAEDLIASAGIDEAPTALSEARCLLEAYAPGGYSVAVFEVDRRYGGPEEGGWYYDCGAPVLEPRFMKYLRGFDSRAAARDYANDVQLVLDAGPNKGRPELHSVACEGVYRARICEGLPMPFPETRPRYE